MKRAVLFFVSSLILFAATLSAPAQGTGFTYQGRLNEGAQPAEGLYDLQFTVYDRETEGRVVGRPLLSLETPVSNGLFAVTLDFGENIFTGAERWLEISVSREILSPRQRFAATPYAVTAGNLTGVVPGGSISGTYSSPVAFDNVANSFRGSGSGLYDVNALTLNGRFAAEFWQLGGNSGTTAGTHFLGTTDNQPLEFKVDGIRALRLEPIANTGSRSNIVNVIGGSVANFVSAGVAGATIAGGGAVKYFGQAGTNRVTGDFGTVGGGARNTTSDLYATVGGGLGNAASNYITTVAGGSFNESIARGAAVVGGEVNSSSGAYAFVGAGARNESRGEFATVGGGCVNIASGEGAFIGGGGMDVNPAYGNRAEGKASVIAGGIANVTWASGDYATIPGGASNAAIGRFSFAAGRQAKALHHGSFVWADDSQSADFVSTINNQFSIRAGGGVRLSDNTPAISFGAQTRQMLNLWGTAYGIGVQASSLYFRCNSGSPNDGFIWYKGGTHADGYADPGGGTELMHLVSGGLYVNGALVPSSDRNAKTNFAPLDTREVLEKVAALPLSRWSYTNDVKTTHLGPMAQDFHAAFGLGTDDKHIATVDADGVALAAIQGLNQKLEKQLKSKDAEILALEARLAKLEEILTANQR